MDVRADIGYLTFVAIRAHLLGAACLALAACRASPEPCSSPGTCPEGSECLANRCVPAGGEPVTSDSNRRVSEPIAIAVVSAHAQSSRELPAVATFGGSARGKTALYLRFNPIWRGGGKIDSAFLLLDPAEGRAPNADVTVTAWRVRGRWSPERLHWLEQPELAPPSADGIARGAPPLPLRIDVTRIVQYLAKHPGSDRGFALIASSGAGPGVGFATGAAGGRAPRLEVYLR